METLIEFTNEETQMRAYVVANSKAGFNVVLQDMDSGENVPFVSIHKTFDAAKAKAAEVVG